MIALNDIFRVLVDKTFNWRNFNIVSTGRPLFLSDILKPFLTDFGPASDLGLERHHALKHMDFFFRPSSNPNTRCGSRLSNNRPKSPTRSIQSAMSYRSLQSQRSTRSLRSLKPSYTKRGYMC